MPLLFTAPTKRAEWVKEGDRCQSQAGMLGTVIRVVSQHHTHTAVVRWDNGHTGRTSITLLRRWE